MFSLSNINFQDNKKESILQKLIENLKVSSILMKIRSFPMIFDDLTKKMLVLVL